MNIQRLYGARIYVVGYCGRCDTTIAYFKTFIGEKAGCILYSLPARSEAKQNEQYNNTKICANNIIAYANDADVIHGNKQKQGSMQKMF